MKMSLNHLTASSAALPTERNTQLTHNAQKLVGQTFFGTLLKQMHNSPFKSKILDGGRGAEAFAPLMDQHLIDRMSKSVGKKLVRTIVHHIDRAEEAKAKGTTSTTPTGAAGDGRQRSFGGQHSQHGPPQFKPAPRNPRPRDFGGAVNTEMRPHVPPGLRA